MPEISLLDVINRGGFEASLITTFNANLPFYEELVLRKLLTAGCRHNVIIMDKKQCTASWSNESLRPKLAGQAYTLLPIGLTGAFHPKICILIGRKKAVVLIGSHNLTISGFGYNHEITNLVQIDDKNDKVGVNLIANVWLSIKNWIELERGKLPEDLLSSAIQFENFIHPFIHSADYSSDESVLFQTPGDRSLIERLYEQIPSDIRRIGVVGAFFDNDFTFIKELNSHWPNAEIVVGIDPDTVQFEGDTKDLNARLVNANLALEFKTKKYFHAKIIYFELTESNGFFLSGSANPSRPAWMGNQPPCNIEAMLIRRGSDGAETAKSIGVDKLFSQPSLDPAILESITIRNRSKDKKNTSDVTWSLLVGIINERFNEVLIYPCGNKIKSNSLEIFSADLDSLATVPIDWDGQEPLRLHIKNVLDFACSCKMFYQDNLVAQVMLHHPNIITTTSNSSKQRQIRNALEALSSDSGDISILVASVEKLIFSEDNHLDVVSALKADKEISNDSDAKVPNSLVTSVDDSKFSNRKHKLIKSGDLAYLLDILIRKLSEGLATSSLDTDHSGRNEEEQVGADDENITDHDELGLPQTALSDMQIAKAVSHRGHKLISKMLAQLERASSNKDLQVTATLQLIAVIGLIRELRRLDISSRWKMTGISLIKLEDRQELFNKSIKYLLGRSEYLKNLESRHESSIDEAFRLKLLLMWLAWDLGLEVSYEIEKLLEKSTRDAQLKANAFFVELLPSIIADADSKLELENSISRTIKLTPKETQRSLNWIEKHWAIGEKKFNPATSNETARRGSFCKVPGIIESPRVILETPPGFISIWNFDDVRTFDRSRVEVFN